MKKMILFTITTSLIASNAFAINQQIQAPNIKTITLFDGRLINNKLDIKHIHLYDEQVDFLELKDGEIIDRSDIDQIQFSNIESFVLASTGVDGGGG